MEVRNLELTKCPLATQETARFPFPGLAVLTRRRAGNMGPSAEPNRRREECLEQLGLSAERLITVRQVHSRKLLVAYPDGTRELYSGAWPTSGSKDAVERQRDGCTASVSTLDSAAAPGPGQERYPGSCPPPGSVSNSEVPPRPNSEVEGNTALPPEADGIVLLNVPRARSPEGHAYSADRPPDASGLVDGAVTGAGAGAAEAAGVTVADCMPIFLWARLPYASSADGSCDRDNLCDSREGCSGPSNAAMEEGGTRPEGSATSRSDTAGDLGPMNVSADEETDQGPLYCLEESQDVATVGAILHSGWKGTGILADAISFFRDRLQVPPDQIEVLFGPCICPRCYRVSAERARAFRERWGEDTAGVYEDGPPTSTGGPAATGGPAPTGGASSTGGANSTGAAAPTGGPAATGGAAATGGPAATATPTEGWIDLRKANLRIAEAWGVRTVRVVTDCTCENPQLGSFRRDGRENYVGMLAALAPFGQ